MSDPSIDGVDTPDGGVVCGLPTRVTLSYRTAEDAVITATTDPGPFTVRLFATEAAAKAGKDDPVRASRNAVTVDAFLLVTRSDPAFGECLVTFSLAASGDPATRAELLHVKA